MENKDSLKNLNGIGAQQTPQPVVKKKRVLTAEQSEAARIRARAYYQNNQDKVRKYKADNAEKIRESKRQSRLKHRDRVIAEKKRHYEKHKDEILAKQKLRYEEKKDEINLRNRAYSKKHYQETKEVYCAKRRVQKADSRNNLSDSYLKSQLGKRKIKNPTKEMLMAEKLSYLIKRESIGKTNQEQSIEIDQISEQLFKIYQQTTGATL